MHHLKFVNQFESHIELISNVYMVYNVDSTGRTKIRGARIKSAWPLRRCVPHPYAIPLAQESTGRRPTYH